MTASTGTFDNSGKLTLVSAGLAVTFLLPVIFLSLYPSLSSNHNFYSLVVAGGLILTHLAVVITASHRYIRQMDLSDYFLFLWLLICSLSVMRTEESLRASGYLSVFILSAYCYYLALHIFRSEAAFKNLCFLMITIGIIVSVQSLPALAFIRLPVSKFIYMFSRNQTTISLLLPFFLCLYLYLSTASRLIKCYCLMSASLIFPVFVFSRSRAVWLALAVVLAIAVVRFLVQRYEKPKLTLAHLWFALACLSSTILIHEISVIYNGKPQLSSVLAKTGETLLYPEEGSAGGRLIIWRNSLEMIKDYLWFGVGLDNWWRIYPLYQNKVFLASYDRFGPFNSWLSLLGEIGLAGMLPLVIFVVLVPLYRNRLTGRSFILTLCLLAMIIASFFHSARRIPYFMYYCFLILGCIRSQAKLSYRPAPKKAALINIAGFLVLALNLAIQLFFTQESAYRTMLFEAQRKRAGSIIESDPLTRLLMPGEIRTSRDLLHEVNPGRAEWLGRFGNHDEESIYVLLADLNFKYQNTAGAIKWIEKAIEERPYDAMRYLAMCRYLYHWTDYYAALRACLSGYAIDPMIPDLPYEIAGLYATLGDRSRQAEYLKRAIEVSEMRLKQHRHEVSKRILTRKWEEITELSKTELKELNMPPAALQGP